MSQALDAAVQRRLAVVMAAGVVLAIGLQQGLNRRAPRLLELSSTTASSGPAALSLRFSRPMRSDSLAAASRLQPELPHQWLGDGNPLRLLLSPGQRILKPIQLTLAGLDRRGLALARQGWLWDPRPRLLAVVPVAGGEQLQLQRRDGRWQALTPVQRSISAVTPLGDGSGIALLSGPPQALQLWLLPLQQQSLRRWNGGRPALMEPQPGPLRRLLPQRLVYAHLSSNRRGDLLAQWGATPLGPGRTSLWPRQGREQSLPLEASGPMQLLPEGGGLVIPAPDGLTLLGLPGSPKRRQVLPGSRDLSSFCPVSGRALLVRHWPDFRRSLELVEPGLAPRQLWLGDDAVLATACDRGGERVWLLLSQWRAQQSLRLLELNRSGTVLAQRWLEGWDAEPGSSMAFDATRQQLLLTLRRRNGSDQPPAAAQPVLIDAGSLQITPQAKAVRQVLWLAAG